MIWTKWITPHDCDQRYSRGLVVCTTRTGIRRGRFELSQVTARPEVESISDTLAFITWTTQNPGGTILHYAVVHYGKDPNHLDLTAESPTRINQGHSEMVFRVRVPDLQPATTYYYKVSSRQADGISDPATSAVNQFTTRPPNRTSAQK